MNGRADWTLAGWVMFTLSGVLFLISGIRAGDVYTVAGSVIWMIGVSFFLIAMRGRS